MKIIQTLSALACLAGLASSPALCGASEHFRHVFAPQEGFVRGPEKDAREEICLNGKWDFMPVVIPEEYSPEQITDPVLPDSPVWDGIPYKVPSPWNVNSFSRGGGGDFTAYPSYPEEWEKAKAGWVHKSVTVPQDWDGRRIVLRFDAVAGFTKVFVNGKVACSHFDSFLPFHADITDFVTPGGQADIMIWIAHPSFFDEPGKYGFRPYPAGSFWGIHIAGIWQDMFLVSLPQVYIEDTFVRPLVSKDSLVAEVTLNNTTGKTQKIKLGADVRKWINDADISVLDFPVPDWHLDSTPALEAETSAVTLAPGKSKVRIGFKPDGRLDLWDTQNPELYGLTVSLDGKGKIRDIDYTRFGWREFTISGKKFYLNGEEIVMKGDSWHFMGIPQMTRRYAYSWYRMLKDANGNAVRLHAQVYPEFYLDMADEMGICVLDESALWASDGGPKMDSEELWMRSREHVRDMVLRDRNHASVLGWSVCNEVMGVMDGVFRDKSRLDEMARQIDTLVYIAQEYDGTRDWVSGDGEVQRKTAGTAFIGHYYIPEMLRDWSKSEIPWGIGEMGMCYAGTPEDVSIVNGDRAFESQEGRMEGLAGEAFASISEQRDLGASYTCIFNLAWYGIQPLEIGLDDISRPLEPQDGIWFGEFVEGQPGVQPERLGPYTTTFNPGYDPDLPLYRTWALFDGVKAAFSDDYRSRKNIWAKKKTASVCEPVADAMEAVFIPSSGSDGLKSKFEDIALSFTGLDPEKRQVIIVDGKSSIDDPATADKIREAMENGSTVLVWNMTPSARAFISQVTGKSISVFRRDATSYIIKESHPMLNGQTLASLYFSEKVKTPVSEYVFSLDGATSLLDPCRTDWTKWNYQGENIKTAQVLRSEREKKPEGSVLASLKVGKGEIIVSALDPFKAGNSGVSLTHEMLYNIGARFTGTPRNLPPAISSDGALSAALVCGSFSGSGFEEVMSEYHIGDADPETLRPGSVTAGHYWNLVQADAGHRWDFLQGGLKGATEDCAVYMSFWLFSPRSLTDLLIEPNIPRLDLHYTVDDCLGVYVNGRRVTDGFDHADAPNQPNALRGLPLEKGWNHIVLKVGQKWGGWNGTFRFSSSDSAFMDGLESAVIR